MLLPCMFFPVKVVLSEVEVEHNPFSECIKETQGQENHCKPHGVDVAIRSEEESLLKERQESRANETLFYYRHSLGLSL